MPHHPIILPLFPFATKRYVVLGTISFLRITKISHLSLQLLIWVDNSGQCTPVTVVPGVFIYSSMSASRQQTQVVFQMSPYSLHSALPLTRAAYGAWPIVVHYVGNRVPFGMQFCTHDVLLCRAFCVFWRLTFDLVKLHIINEDNLPSPSHLLSQTGKSVYKEEFTVCVCVCVCVWWCGWRTGLEWNSQEQ